MELEARVRKLEWVNRLLFAVLAAVVVIGVGMAAAEKVKPDQRTVEVKEIRCQKMTLIDPDGNVGGTWEITGDKTVLRLKRTATAAGVQLESMQGAAVVSVGDGKGVFLGMMGFAANKDKPAGTRLVQLDGDEAVRWP